jgi:hypothetical protein
MNSEQFLANPFVLIVNISCLLVHYVLIQGFKMLCFGSEPIGGVLFLADFLHFGQ